MLYDRANALLVAALFFLQGIALAVITCLCLRILQKSYEKRYLQFGKAVRNIGIWAVIGCSAVMIRLVGEAAFRP